MNEPLTTSKPEVVFTGKTYNKHPQWYNQPLRLTEEQLENPILILDEFFQLFHLNETREVLWQWLTAIISSPGSISSDPLERSNHIYFYEKIEEVIEAAFILKSKRLTVDQDVILKENSTSTQSAELEQENADEILNKEKELIEYVHDNPIYVITEVFKNESLSFLRDQLRDWLLVALSADTAIYEEGEQRKQLLLFQDQLQVLVEALFIIYTQDREKANVRVHLTETDKPRLLSQDQFANPTQVIAGFFEQFPMVYITRELNDWLEAGIAYSGDYPDNMSELQVFYTYRNILCLIKAANRL